MSNSVSPRIILAPLPEHLRVKHDSYDADFQSPWFKGEDGGVLTFKFDRDNFEVNLNIPLPDGSLLTDKPNKPLYMLVKSWIHEQHYPRSNKLSQMKNRTAKKKLWTVLRSLDKVLLDANTLQVHKHGFGLLTPGTINSYTNEFINSNNAHESIYAWPKTLSNYLIAKISEPRTYVFDDFVRKHPEFLEPVAEREKRCLMMTDDEIFQARVWLYHNGMYKKSEYESWPGHITTSKLVSILYPHCTMAEHMRPVSHELEIQQVYGHMRELPQIPVREEKFGATALRYDDFRRSLSSQKYLPASALRIPDVTLDELNKNDHKSKLALLGTYVTLPHFLTISVLQRSILFYEENSELILNYLADVISSAARLNIEPGAYHTKYLSNEDNSESKFNAWNLYSPAEITRSQNINSHPVSRMRRMEGVLQAYYALLGSIQYTVGFFTARRQSELLKLKFEDVHSNQSYLSTSVMKTGIGENRLTFDLPTIPTVLRMLGRLERFFKDCGLTNETIQKSPCFGRISLGRNPRVVTAGSKRYNTHLDVLCDLIETDIVDGRRYYVRQHQLRRAFAIGFFYLNSRKNLSVLSYYFGHMDFKQIYRYLTTVVGNKEMLDIKAAYLAEETLQAGQASVDLLEKLGSFAPGTALKVQERNRLENYYRSLLKDQDIEVEPTFLSVGGCEEMLISVTVRKQKNG
ncbi:hypothetical protein [Pseudomonas cichorii]|uniref:Phage integrase protein n=1 Tax=Pseudomonas cichorii TaxID=36746 RepID=A0A3M4WDR0_PSECI|nr:hypothetical protein [Pseudomonas cichorii]RMR62254.1 hypothetical protein ALP84_200082 [Pseudomonas cichorii]